MSTFNEIALEKLGLVFIIIVVKLLEIMLKQL